MSFPAETREAHVAIAKLTDAALSAKLKAELEFAAKVTRGSPVWWESVWLAEVCRAEAFKRGLERRLILPTTHGLH